MKVFVRSAIAVILCLFLTRFTATMADAGEFCFSTVKTTDNRATLDPLEMILDDLEFLLFQAVLEGNQREADSIHHAIRVVEQLMVSKTSGNGQVNEFTGMTADSRQSHGYSGRPATGGRIREFAGQTTGSGRLTGFAGQTSGSGR